MWWYKVDPNGQLLMYIPGEKTSYQTSDGIWHFTVTNGHWTAIPWSFNFIASTPAEPVGPALTIAYHPSNAHLFVGIGLGISEGKNVGFGPLYPLPGTKSEQIDNVLGGGSISWGYNWPNLVGAQITGNNSGGMGGPTIGVPGTGASATFSLQIDLRQAYEFLLEHF
jgi:hypothetical protein